MKRLILFVVGFYFAISCYGQVTQKVKRWIDETPYEKNAENFNHPSVKGTPFYSNIFIKGNIFLKNDRIIEGISINYNMVEDCFFFQRTNQVVRIENKRDIIKVEFAGKVFVNTEFMNSDNERQSGFLIVLARGDCELYKRIQKEFKEAKDAGTYSSAEEARFEKQKPQYYIKTPSAKRIESINQLWNKEFLKTMFPGSWREKFMETFFPEEKEKLLTMVEENNIKLRKEEGLIEFVNRYNNLN